MSTLGSIDFSPQALLPNVAGAEKRVKCQTIAKLVQEIVINEFPSYNYTQKELQARANAFYTYATNREVLKLDDVCESAWNLYLEGATPNTVRKFFGFRLTLADQEKWHKDSAQ